MPTGHAAGLDWPVAQRDAAPGGTAQGGNTLDDRARNERAGLARPCRGPTRAATRLDDLDRAKGMAILLVVFGHLVARADPAGLLWYEPLRIGIYLFHMPFFMYLSGYVAFRFGAAEATLRGWPALVRRRAARLLVPFAAFGLLILVAKLVASRYTAVDNVPSSLADGLWTLIWETEHSPSTSIWYIGVLFVYAVATPLLLAASRGRMVLAVAVAAVLFAVPVPDRAYGDRICHFYLFFIVGGLAARAGAAWLGAIDRWRWPALLGLALVTTYVASGAVTFDWPHALSEGPYRWFLLVAGLLSIPALHGIARLQLAWLDAPLQALGRASFVIYLLNTLMIGAAKAGLLLFLTWSDHDFPILAALMMVAGVGGPILIKRTGFRVIPIVDRLTD